MTIAGGGPGARVDANTNQCHPLTYKFEGVYCCWNLVYARASLVYARASFQRIKKQAMLDLKFIQNWSDPIKRLHSIEVE